LLFFSLVFALALFTGTYTPASASVEVAPAAPIAVSEAVAETDRAVPFFSQFLDISSANWQKVGCGIASLAMIMEYYDPESFTSVDELLNEGIQRGAFIPSVGWSYAGLIGVGGLHGFTGESFDLGWMTSEGAYTQFKAAAVEGPVIASVHYTFQPTNPIPHLVVVNRIEGDVIHYNDPAEPTGGGTLSVEKFLKAWKQRYIVIRPIIEDETLLESRVAY
jgi:ABC-type bacteriocin/lantibiotic exporter with double-glycine peptidase domain